jgi:hypothetical protein
LIEEKNPSCGMEFGSSFAPALEAAGSSASTPLPHAKIPASPTIQDPQPSKQHPQALGRDFREVLKIPPAHTFLSVKILVADGQLRTKCGCPGFRAYCECLTALDGTVACMRL